MRKEFEVTLKVRQGNTYLDVLNDTYLESRELVSAIQDKALFLCLQLPGSSTKELIPILSIQQGYLADRPEAGVPGRLYLDSQSLLYFDNGSYWITINPGITPYAGNNPGVIPVFSDSFGVGTLVDGLQFSNIKATSAESSVSRLTILEINENIKLAD